MRDTLLISERLYNTLLNLYPPQFRAAHGRQMLLAFHDACWAAYGRGGAAGLISLWLPTLLDLLKSALEERARQGELIMSRERFMGLAGPLTMIIGLLWITASVGEFVLLVKWGSPDSFWDLFWFFPVALSFILMIPAFIGTRLRYKEAAGETGRLGLILNVAGCVGMAIFMLGSMALGFMGIGQDAWANTVITACFMTPMIGHILFGIDTVRHNLLARWNVIPLLVGLPSVLLFVPDLLIQPSTPNRFELTLVITFSRFIFTGIAWVLMGYVMLGRQAGRAGVSRVGAEG